jgi:hypothetical protein
MGLVSKNQVPMFMSETGYSTVFKCSHDEIMLTYNNYISIYRNSDYQATSLKERFYRDSN